jgi:predicted MPP superfamily phosphohydrolase
MTLVKNLFYNDEHGLTMFRKSILIVKMTVIIMITIFVLFQTTGVNESNLAYGSLDNKNLPDFNFAAAGDWGCTQSAKDTVQNILHKNPELVLGLGDYSYQNTADCWIRLVEPLEHKMKIAIGNHEHLLYTNRTYSYPSPSLLQQYMVHFNLTKQYYSFEYQNVHFTVISTEVPFKTGSDQYDFVENDLEKSASDPNIDWIVALYHRLAYTSESFLDSIPALRKTYHPLFEKYDVDLVLQGHSHNYQRTFPIMYNNRTTAGPIITENEKTSYLNPKGQIFATVGTGGVPEIHNFTGARTNFTASQFNAFGFLNIDVIDNGTQLVGRFYDNDGTIKDRFKIIK